MSFVERAIESAGLLPVLEARRAGLPLPSVAWDAVDLLLLGAMADQTRQRETGDAVDIHPGRTAHVTWIDGADDLDVLRKVAVARVAGPRGARIGVDWARVGLELAQVALGFGASDLTGPITRKNGLAIVPGESLKVKGKGRVALASIKRAEVASLVMHAGRIPMFVDEHAFQPEAAQCST
jgi:hypothetical protein